MDKLLILGASRGTLQIIEAAKRMGVYSILVAPEGYGRSIDSLPADEVWNIDTSDVASISVRAREVGVNGVIAGVSQFNICMAMQVARNLDLPFYCDEESWHYTMDKRAFKELCALSGVPVAKSYEVERSEDGSISCPDIEFPVVVKAVDLSANRGMSYCYDARQIAPACEKALKLSKSDNVIIEKMMHGREYTAHYALANGESSLINFCSMFHQPGFPSNCYSLTSTKTGRLKQYLDEVDAPFRLALKRSGAREGVAWIEMMLDDDDHFYVLEMGYRMSGELWALPMRDVCGFDSYSWLIECTLNGGHDAVRLPPSESRIPSKTGCSYILWSEHEGTIAEIDGLDEIAMLGGDINVDCALKPGDSIGEHCYMAVITFSAEDDGEVRDRILEINRTVKIIDTEGRDLCIRFDDFESFETA